MATASIWDVVDAMETGLTSAVPSGVSVFSTPDDPAGPNADILGIGLEIETDQEHFAMGGSRAEDYAITGRILVSRPANSSAASKQARERVEAILDTIENYIRNNPTIGGTALHAQITSMKTRQVVIGTTKVTGRGCECEFVVTVKAII